MSLQIGIFLFSHHGRDDDARKVAQTINTCIDYNVPYTFFLTGHSLDGIARVRGDVVSRIRRDAANKLAGWDPHKVEIGISTADHVPVSQPGLSLEYWGAYYEGFVRQQIRYAREKLEGAYHRSPRGFFPPEGMFCPGFVYLLKQEGIDYTIMPGEFLGDDRWAKGQVYHQTPEYRLGDTKIVTRINEINPEFCSWNMRELKERMKDFAYSFGLEKAVFGADADWVAGIRRVDLKEGNRLMLELWYNLISDPDVDFRNVASIADSYWHPRNIYHLYAEHGIPDAHHHISSWMDGRGSLDKLDGYVNGLISDFIITHTEKLRQRRDGYRLEEAKHAFFPAAGIEHRNKDWNSGLKPVFEWNYDRARGILAAA